MDSFDIIRQILVEKFDVDAAAVTPDATFETLDLDSLSQVELGTTLQKRLGVPISDVELQAVETLKDIQVLIESKL